MTGWFRETVEFRMRGVFDDPDRGHAAVDTGVRAAGAVRLRRRADGRWRKTALFCAWLAWSRFRVVVPLRDKTIASVVMAIDRALRAPSTARDVPVDRQREDRVGRSRVRDRGPQPADRQRRWHTRLDTHAVVPG